MVYLLSRGQICVYSITYFVYKAHSEYFLQGAPRHSESSQRVADTSDVIHEVDATGRKMNSVLNQKGRCQGIRRSGSHVLLGGSATFTSSRNSSSKDFTAE